MSRNNSYFSAEDLSLLDLFESHSEICSATLIANSVLELRADVWS